MWFNLAAAKGRANALAVKNRDIIAKKMTPQQMAERRIRGETEFTIDLNTKAVTGAARKSNTYLQTTTDSSFEIAASRITEICNCTLLSHARLASP